MASTADIARLLNTNDCDSSALAEVIADYFDCDLGADADAHSSSEDESGIITNAYALLLALGMNNT